MYKIISENIIQELYNKHYVKNDEYFKRFENIPSLLTDQEKKEWINRDVPRLISIFDFKDWIKKYNIQTGNNLLYTCDTDVELKFLNYKNNTYIPYPPVDLHTFSSSKKDHNFVIFNQTLEHLYNPYLAIKNLYNHMDYGGYLYTTVPSINIPHMMPIHYWGITPMGLMAMMYSCGFEICELGYWGNKKYIDYIFTKNWWPDYTQIQTNGIIDNDLVCQAQTWILVKKS